MLEQLGIIDSIRMIVYLMLSLSFFIGILLTVSYEAFEEFNKALQREYGIKKKIVSPIEDYQNSFVDWIILKYRFISGILIATASFILLLIYKF